MNRRSVFLLKISFVNIAVLDRNNKIHIIIVRTSKPLIKERRSGMMRRGIKKVILSLILVVNLVFGYYTVSLAASAGQEHVHELSSISKVESVIWEEIAYDYQTQFIEMF